MELEDWEYLSDKNLFNSQIVEENTSLINEQDQRQAFSQVALSPSIEQDPGDVLEKEIREITEEFDAAPQIHLETLHGIEESKEVEVQEEEVSKEENSELEILTSSELYVEEVKEVEEVSVTEPNRNDFVNGSDQRISGWRMRGIGALSSVGIAAATVSMLILGGCKRNQNRELQIQIYADDKGMKQVPQQATKLSQALLAVRGTPATTANVSFGGYYQGL